MFGSEDFDGVIGRTYHDSTPSWTVTDQPADRPTVVFVVLDDTGFGSLGCYGSEIATPTMDRLAAEGTRFTNFHATALCSPTRACLLTGRNHHNVGLGYLSHVDDGFPGYRGRVSPRAATLAEMLVDNGYNTMAVGKWHLAPMDQTTAAGPYDQWPLGRGFERYYGFLEGLTDHYYPELYYDNHIIAPPASPENGYHLTSDLVDKAIGFVRDQTSVAREKPFFMYLAFGATHTPHQAPPELVEKYAGTYDVGWDEIRRQRHERQLEMGIIPSGTPLPPSNEGVEPWNLLTPEAQRLYAKFQEVFAGFLEHTDRELGRLLRYLEDLGRLDNTLVVLVSDNGASQEGGPHGVLNTTTYENGHLPSLEDNLAHIDEIDGVTAHVNYPLGWAQAGNTPLKRYKQNTHAGGIRTPMVMRHPALVPQGELRDHFQHVTDIVPTVLDIAGITPPATYRGVPQMPIDGVSMRSTLTAPHDVDRSRTQYFETLGHRAIWKDGWKAVAYHPLGEDFDADVWELYDIDADFSECTDLAEKYPDKLAEMIELWWDEAAKNNVLPLDDRRFAERSTMHIRPDSPRNRTSFTYYNGMHHIGSAAAPIVAGHSYEIRATVHRHSAADDGVLVAHGSVNSGYCVMIEDGHLVYDFNYYGEHTNVRSERPVPTGTCDIKVRFHKRHGPEAGRPDTSGDVRLFIDGADVGGARLSETFDHMVAFQGLDVGGDRLSPTRQDGAGAFPFSGDMDSVTIEILSSEREEQTRVVEPKGTTS